MNPQQAEELATLLAVGRRPTSRYVRRARIRAGSTDDLSSSLDVLAASGLRGGGCIQIQRRNQTVPIGYGFADLVHEVKTGVADFWSRGGPADGIPDLHALMTFVATEDGRSSSTFWHTLTCGHIVASWQPTFIRLGMRLPVWLGLMCRECAAATRPSVYGACDECSEETRWVAAFEVSPSIALAVDRCRSCLTF